MLRFISFLALSFISSTSFAIDAKQFDDVAKQERYEDLIYELRCPVCQNQNLADSNAPLAKDLRSEIFEQIESGKTDDDIVDFMVTRYGEFVQYRPPLQAKTLLLWGLPIALLFIGMTVAFISIRRQANIIETQVDKTKLDSLLDEIQQEEKLE